MQPTTETASRVEYVIGADRNNPDDVRSHLYANTPAGLLPMCGYGWNRSDGEALSILRGYRSARGICLLCQRNIDEGREPVKAGFRHKTKWL